MLNFVLADHGDAFSTRPRAAELRSAIIRLVGDSSEVCLDFSGVLSVSASFADELVGRLVHDVDEGTVPFDVRVAHASPDVERVLRPVVRRRACAPEAVFVVPTA